MKIALITDQHFGARTDSIALSDYFKKFYETVFFPFLEENGINRVIGLGDTFDRRKYINFDTLRRCREYYFDVLQERGITLDLIVGNHDTYFKNTNEVNSPSLLLSGEYKNINIIASSCEIVYDGLPIAFVPWICTDNQEETFNFIKSTKAQVLMGHLDLIGFEMHRGAYNYHGYNAKLFDKFDVVCSGHFHHRSSRGNINYLGSPYEMSWSDFGDPKGFHVFDTDTRKLTFVKNPYCLFNKLEYDDSDKTLEDITAMEFDHLADSYVKVIVSAKNNPYWFDIFIQKLEKVGLGDLQVTDDHLNLDIDDEEHLLGDDVETTVLILRQAAEQIGEYQDLITTEEMGSFLTTLYNEALFVE